MVPSLASFLLRSRRYGNVHAEPTIARKTEFFAAASLVTSALALVAPSRFLRDLSERLEVTNMARAHGILTRQLYPDDTIEKNTADFIHYEQGLVQTALDSLRHRQPELYRREVGCANFLLNALNRTVLRHILRSSFARAVRAAAAELGSEIDFACQNHREAVGMQLARAEGAARRLSANWNEPTGTGLRKSRQKRRFLAASIGSAHRRAR